MDQPLQLSSDDLPEIGEVRRAAIRCTDSLLPGLRQCADAGLLRACAKFDALERQSLALYYGPSSIEDDDERDRALAPIKARMDRVLQDICELRAVTLEGHRARAAAVALYAPDLITEKDLGGYTDQSIVGALLRDLLAEGGGMSPRAVEVPRPPRKPVMPSDVRILARRMAEQVRTLADRSGARETVVTSALMLLADELMGELVATHVLLATRLGEVV